MNDQLANAEDYRGIASIKFIGVEGGRAKFSGHAGTFTHDAEAVAHTLADAQQSVSKFESVLTAAQSTGDQGKWTVKGHSAWSSYASELKKAKAALAPTPAGWAVAETDTPQ